MYANFFGLNDIPFSIAPNPEYLFMSERHKEALAHLTYGLGTTGGFVLLTGEVGTGKTTVSRCILDGLSDDTQAAFILNPTLSSQELLATICDEFGIFYNKAGATLKSLTDKIQERLLENHASGMNTLLIIDEAQHLKAEVLEQLRLLTNLETNTKKLLQVILIGQPELQTLLKRQDLRQLAQRITARYHLLPLNKKETQAYIEHRLLVAGGQQKIFTNKAISTIHLLSKGIPRLINLLCDRALLGAFGNNKTQVDHKLVLGASREALGEEYHLKSKWKGLVKPSLLILSLLLIAATIGFYSANFKLLPINFKVEPVVNPPKKIEIIKEQFSTNDETAVNLNTVQKTLAEQVKVPKIEASKVIEQVSIAQKSSDLPSSASQLFQLWQIAIDQPLTEPCKQANLFRLSCYWHQGNLTSLLKLGYPAVFKFIDDDAKSFYGLLIKNENGLLTFQFGEEQQTVTREWLDTYWQGGALVFWQPPVDDFGELADYVTEQDAITLLQWIENKLSVNQKRPTRIITSIDPLLKNQLAQFQRQHGIVEQSFAGTKTLMLLANSVAQGLPIYSVK